MLALNKHQEAIDCYNKAIAIKQDYYEAIWNKSLALLLLGKLKEGFNLYESRWQKKHFTTPQRSFVKPLWLGNFSLDGKTILVHSEQGFGDTIQFCRYIKKLKNHNCNIILEVEKTIIPLMKQLNAASLIVEKGQALPEFDCHIPIMSFPLAFGTTLETIPTIKSYFNADREKENYFRSKLDINRPKIGLAWSGSSTHVNDSNRSIKLELLLKLLKFFSSDFEYVCLQQEVREDDRIVLDKSNIKFYGDELNNFDDTVALISNVDLIISVDTSVAHLSASLGKDTFVLLPFSPDWRWMTDRNDSPWYPTVKLFRQESFGDWDCVFEKLRLEMLYYLKMLRTLQV